MKNPGRVETCIGALILAALAGILATVLAVQSRYDPALFKALEIKGHPVSLPGSGSTANSASALAALAPEGLTVLGEGEAFDSETLSDKINGKAELYLSAGFAGLTTQRFARRNDPKSWLELFIYDMGNPQNAFSVYSLQKRKDSVTAEGLGPLAYITENALFLANGSKYIEIVSADTTLAEEMRALAGNFIKANPEKSSEATELALFPEEGLDRSSIALHMSDVFGCAGLERVYTARYAAGGEQVTAFVSRRDNPGEAAALAAEYSRFLLENGGTELGEVQGVPGVKIFQVFDTFEVVLNRGPFFAGVHEVDGRNAAEEIAARIHRKLEGAANE